MSRIGGLIVPGGTPNRAAQLAALADGLASAPEWRRSFSANAASEDAGALLAWAGWTTPRMVSRSDHMACCVDGLFYAVNDRPPQTDEATALLDLYDEFGFPGALERINGDFACALFDGRRNALWLGRDRVGVRPLYYLDRPGLFAFASRPRALLALPNVTAEPELDYVARVAAGHYRMFDNDPHASPYRGIRQLPAAHWLRLTPDGIRIGQWWTLTDQPEWEDDEDELAERCRALFFDAVRVRLERSERPAFTLSGGLDSSSVLSTAAVLRGVGQTAFTSVYEDKTYDESDQIGPMLERRVAAWSPIRVPDKIDLFDAVDRLIGDHDEPVATATWLAHHILVEQAGKQGFDALFGGLGGDELNAGEYEYFVFHFADLRAADAEPLLEEEIAAWAAHHDHPIHRKTPAIAAAALARLTDAARPGFVKPDLLRLTRYAHVLDPDRLDLLTDLPFLEHPFGSALKNRTWQDLTRETAPCCLRAEDRHANRFGVQHCDPFLDHRLVEFMFRVPGRLKIRDGITKRLLRRAMTGVLPEETRTRVAKTGWNAPAHVWFDQQADQLRDLIGSRRFRERGLYRPDAVAAVLDDHQEIMRTGAAREHHGMFLWQLLNTSLWLDRIGA